MNDNSAHRIDYLEAVTRAAQYLASLQPTADRWVEFGQLLVRFFQADLVAIAGREPDGQLAFRYTNLVDAAARARLMALLGSYGTPVLDSGFLAAEIIVLPEPYSVILLPLARDKRVDTLLVVGHKGDAGLPKPLLDIYLAVARLMESTLARLSFDAQLRLRVREQACVAALGHRALEGNAMSGLMDEAVRRVAATMRVDYCGLFELSPDGNSFRLRAGFGWRRDAIADVAVDAGPDTLPGHALQSGKGSVEENAVAAARFAAVPLFVEHDIISSAVVALSGRERAHGILSVHTRSPRVFSDEEINFLQSVANVVAAAWERRRAEVAIRRLNEELEARVWQRTAALQEALQELQDINYSVSHDLRTPLRAIDGFAGILMKEHGEHLDEEAQRLLHVVRDNAQTMGRLIDDILSFSQVGRVEMTASPVDMTALAKSVWRTRQRDVARRQVVFRVAPLPPATGDRTLLREVFARLVDNALKFTRTVESAMIEVDGRVTETEHIYAVRDNGIGFDMRYAGKLFGVFQRLHPEQPFEGTGIGLAVVKRIVTRHGGRVWAEGAPDGGATFYFALPAKEERHG